MRLFGDDGVPYFLDSNVILGFVFRHSDRQGEWACEIMENTEEKHSGYVVRTECFGEKEKSGRADQILQAISNEFLRAQAEIRKYGVAGFRLRFDVRKFPRTGQILQGQFEKGRISDDSALRESLWSFEGEYQQRKNRVLGGELVVWHDRRAEEYTALRDILRENIDNPNDVEVLLDAHDAGLRVGRVVFVTGDWKDIGRNQDVICMHLTGVAEVKIYHPS